MVNLYIAPARRLGQSSSLPSLHMFLEGSVRGYVVLVAHTWSRLPPSALGWRSRGKMESFSMFVTGHKSVEFLGDVVSNSPFSTEIVFVCCSQSCSVFCYCFKVLVE